MKKCPFCAEEIKDEAIKCRYCNEFLIQEVEPYVPQIPLGFNEAIRTCFSKYFDFSGRARGSEYWYFFLFTSLSGIVVATLDMTLFGYAWEDSGPLSIITSLGLFIPSLSAATRRLHDSGKSGWWQLLSITIIGVIPVLYWLIRKGDANKNAYDAS